ncbi:hypothetical protein K661_01684, partial [Piscirickettsia salmonis LF-89 = ATCC VR-1361]
SQLRSAKNPNLPRPTHPVLSTPWLAASAFRHQKHPKALTKALQ